MKESIWQKNARKELRAALRKIGRDSAKLLQSPTRTRKSKSRPARQVWPAGSRLKKPAMAITRRPGIIRKSGRRIKGRAALRRALGYASRLNKNFEVLTSNLFSRVLNLWLQEFQIEARRRPDLQETVVHEILSWHPHRAPTNAEMAEVARRHLEAAGFEGCSFITFKHSDTQHLHLHIFVSRVKPDGGVVSLSQNWKKWTKNLRQIEIDMALQEPPQPTKPGSSDQAVNARGRAKRLGTATPVIDPQKIRAALAQSRSQEELQRLLLLEGIELSISRSIDGTVRGLLLRNQGSEEWLAGSSVNRDFSLPRVQRKLKENSLTASAGAALAPRPVQSQISQLPSPQG